MTQQHTEELRTLRGTLSVWNFTMEYRIVTLWLYLYLWTILP